MAIKFGIKFRLKLMKISKNNNLINSIRENFSSKNTWGQREIRIYNQVNEDFKR